MADKHIAIIGAGPAGLTFARLLQVNSISFTLYERDPAQGFRLQGGTLDLHPDSGQAALLEAGLLDHFNKEARYHDQDYRIMDKDGKDWLFQRGEPDSLGRPEIDRPLLRNLLIKSIEPQNLKWNHHVSEVLPRDDGKYELHFKGQSAPAVADLVVGADGPWSKVRLLLTDVKPDYAGMTIVDGVISDFDAKCPEISKFVGRGTIFAMSEGKGIMSQRNGDGSYRVYSCLKVPGDWAAKSAAEGWSWDNTEKVKEKLISTYYHNWDSRLKDMLEAQDSKLTTRPIYRIPLGTRWKTRPGVAIIGDAAHVMSPMAGEGVNIAMLDSLDLFHAIKEEKDYEAAVRKFELNQCDRADATNKLSQELLDKALMDDAPKVYAAAMADIMDDFAMGRVPT